MPFTCLTSLLRSRLAARGILYYFFIIATLILLRAWSNNKIDPKTWYLKRIVLLTWIGCCPLTWFPLCLSVYISCVASEKKTSLWLPTKTRLRVLSRLHPQQLEAVHFGPRTVTTNASADNHLNQISFHLFQSQREKIQIAGQCAILLRFRLRTGHVKNAVPIVHHL